MKMNDEAKYAASMAEVAAKNAERIADTKDYSDLTDLVPADDDDVQLRCEPEICPLKRMTGESPESELAIRLHRIGLLLSRQLIGLRGAEQGLADLQGHIRMVLMKETAGRTKK